MTGTSGHYRKRHADGSPDGMLPAEDTALSSSSRSKKRFVLHDQAQALPDNDGATLSNNASTTSLDVLAAAAASAPRMPLKNRKRQIFLSKTPSPPRKAAQFDFMISLVSHVDILLEVVRYLPPDTLLTLYCISAPFHYVMNSHYTAFIMAATHTCSPNAEQYFPWWCYRHLCIEDPARRPARTDRRSMSWDDFHPPVEISSASDNMSNESSNPQQPRSEKTMMRVKQETVIETTERLAELDRVRKAAPAAVPGIRWLKMVAYRELVCKEIIGWMAAHGHRLPPEESLDALKRTWFLIDIPVNGPRVALIHNPNYFSKTTLSVMQLIFIKLDMLYCNPVHMYGGETSMRELLLSERTLTTLWNYLRGADGKTRLDILRLWIRHRYKRPQPPRPMDRATQQQHEAKMRMPIMGVPPYLVGRWGYECWGLGRIKLLRPDQLVVKEGLKRQMHLHRMVMPHIAYGYLDKDIKPLPNVVKPEDVVLSLICRKKNKKRQLEEKEADMMDIDK